MTETHQTEGNYFGTLSDGLEERTREYSLMGVDNGEKNLPFMEKSIRELIGGGAGKTCLVVSGGPSLRRHDSLNKFKSVLDKMIIVSADGSLGHCLRSDIIPDYVLSLDPHGERIVRWFGDDDLSEEKLKDDYFRRQDLDEHLNLEEIEKNEEQIALVNKFGPKINAVLSSSAPENVRRRCIESGMNVFWWNPIYDDPASPNSLTRKVREQNKLPCMNTGGNVGSAATIFAVSVLQAAKVVMIGMDFSYYGDTPIEKTQYYDQFKKFMSEAEIEHAFRHYKNPHTGGDFYTDPAYDWYRQSFFTLFKDVEGCHIINATEGGILFGDSINWCSPEEIVEMIQCEG